MGLYKPNKNQWNTVLFCINQSLLSECSLSWPTSYVWQHTKAHSQALKWAPSNISLHGKILINFRNQARFPYRQVHTRKRQVKWGLPRSDLVRCKSTLTQQVHNNEHTCNRQGLSSDRTTAYTANMGFQTRAGWCLANPNQKQRNLKLSSGFLLGW